MTDKEATYTGKEMPYMERKPLTLGRYALYGSGQGSHLHWEGDALYGSRQGSHLHWEGDALYGTDKEAS